MTAPTPKAPRPTRRPTQAPRRPILSLFGKG